MFGTLGSNRSADYEEVDEPSGFGRRLRNRTPRNIQATAKGAFADNSAPSSREISRIKNKDLTKGHSADSRAMLADEKGCWNVMRGLTRRRNRQTEGAGCRSGSGLKVLLLGAERDSELMRKNVISGRSAPGLVAMRLAFFVAEVFFACKNRRSMRGRSDG